MKGGVILKELILSSTAKIQENSTNMLVLIPSTVRSVLKPKKGDEIEFMVYSDKTIEIRIKEKG